MADERELLAAIRERPDDQLLRLVYADWLQDRGDPRHELVPLETALLRLPVWAEEYYRRKPDRDRLRGEFDTTWLADLGYVRTYRPMFAKLPESRADRWRLGLEFIDVWHGRPVGPEDGYAEGELNAAEMRLGRKLPAAERVVDSRSPLTARSARTGC